MPISFKSKKRKADEEATKKLAEGGTGMYTTTARRSANPEGGKKLKRGTVVKGYNEEVKTGKFKETPARKELVKKGTTTPDKYVPGDFQKKVEDRKTTPELVKQLKENPEKAAARMKAQAEGKTSYIFKGKKEYSGRIEKGTTTPDEYKDIPGTKTPITETKHRMTIHRRESDKGERPGKRLIERVPYLRKKSAGKGISKEGKRKKTEKGH